MQTLKQNSVMITKLNMVLVQIVKNDWPHNWSTKLLLLSLSQTHMHTHAYTCTQMRTQFMEWSLHMHRPNFIPELVNSSKTSESLCTNNMKILLLLRSETSPFSPPHSLFLP